MSIKNEREHKNGVIRACLTSPHSSGNDVTAKRHSYVPLQHFFVLITCPSTAASWLYLNSLALSGGFHDCTPHLYETVTSTIFLQLIRLILRRASSTSLHSADWMQLGWT